MIMKMLNRIFAGAGVLAVLAACSQKAEFATSSFVSFDATSAEVAENAASLEIPVYAYAKNGELAFPRSESANTSITFEVVDGTAKNGTDFTVEPANGVLAFDGSSQSNITVKPVAHTGVRTGDLNFTIRIVGASDGYTLGGAREISVNIKDQDHPLANILGSYTATGDCMGTPMSWTLNLIADDEDESIVWVDAMVPFATSYLGYMDVYGVVSADLKTITFTTLQETSLLYAEGDPFVFLLYLGNLSLSGKESQVVFTQEEEGVFTTEEGVCFVPLGAMAAYNGALIEPGTMTWKKN